MLICCVAFCSRDEQLAGAAADIARLDEAMVTLEIAKADLVQLYSDNVK